MEYKAQEVKAGMMVVFSIVLLLIFLIAITGIKLNQSKKIYKAYFSYTSGLEIGSVVRFGGMEVGYIKDMRIHDKNNSQIEFDVEIDGDIPVKTNSVAIVTAIGLMGEFHVNISTGTPDAELLKSGSVLICKDVPQIMQLMEPVGEIAEQLNEIMSEVKQIVGPENQSEIKSILSNLNVLLDENKKSVDLMMDNFTNISKNLNGMTQKMDEMLISNEENIANSLKHLDETLVQSKDLIERLDKMVVNLDNVVVTKGNNFIDIMDNLKKTTNHLEQFSRSIKERPWQLVRKSAPPERKIQ